MPNLPAADLAAVLRAVPPGASSASGAVRRARAAWERAPRFVRAQTAVLLAADPRGGEEPLSPGGEPLSADRLPCALALATLASTEDWTGLDPAEADALGADVLRRLASAGYPTERLAPLDAAAAARLDGDGRTQPQRIARAEALVAGDAPPPANLRLARALLRAAHRACLHGLHGLVLPAEVRAAEAEARGQVRKRLQLRNLFPFIATDSATREPQRHRSGRADRVGRFSDRQEPRPVR